MRSRARTLTSSSLSSLSSLGCFHDSGSRRPSSSAEDGRTDLAEITLNRVSPLRCAPDEVKLAILSLLSAKEIVRISGVCKEWHRLCFDGSLWNCFDAAPFYNDIPACQLVRIIVGSGRFIRHLNLRGCSQLSRNDVHAIASACKNLDTLILETCRSFDLEALSRILINNPCITTLDLSCLDCVTNHMCKRIASHLPFLEVLDLSCCHKMDSTGLKRILLRCRRLQELRLYECRDIVTPDVMLALYSSKSLQHLHLAGCQGLTDESIGLLIEGTGMGSSLSSLRMLNLSRCSLLTTTTLRNLADKVEQLECLEVAALNVSDMGFQILMPTLQHLTHLDCEDCVELTDLTLLSIARSPSSGCITHLQFSYCESLTDVGVTAILKDCPYLQSLELDNTNISDVVLAEAAHVTRRRSRSFDARFSLRLTVYDCHNITWNGVRHVLDSNASIRHVMDQNAPIKDANLIKLKCFYGWQKVVDAHTRRLVRGEVEKAAKIERDWIAWMTDTRRRRRTQVFTGDATDVEDEVEDYPNRHRWQRLSDCRFM